MLLLFLLLFLLPRFPMSITRDLSANLPCAVPLSIEKDSERAVAAVNLILVLLVFFIFNVLFLRYELVTCKQAMCYKILSAFYAPATLYSSRQNLSNG
mmetsp:Transcript_3864/g.5235  ORF Transcript_3864/g.5235 Transcript_3864/m.5235 type:complete len:98 (-) Transcript_3864:38-331(-)